MTMKPKPIAIAPETVEAAKRGDQFAISEIYEKCYNTIYYVVKSIIVDEDTTQDIVQDSFMKAFNNISKLDNASSFVPWLKRLATNTAKDWLKKKKPILFSSLYPDDDDNDEQEPEIEDVDLTQQPEEALDAKTKKQLLWDIINELSEEQRLVVSMFYFQEMSVAEIAESLGVSQGTIKSRLNYARKKIECKVLDLEKKGTKLYSLAPIPFLIWLFMQNQQANAISAPAISITTTTGAKTIGGASAKTAASTSAKVGAAAGKGLAVKIAVGVVGVTAVGGIAFGLVQTKSPALYSWYLEPTVTVSDINVLVQEVPDAYRDNAADSTNWQHMYSGDACYYTTPEGVGIINHDGEILVPANYQTVSVQEFGTIVLTDDTGSYKVSEDGQLTAYEKPSVQVDYEEYLIKNYGHSDDGADVGLSIPDDTFQNINGNIYYDAGVACDGLYAVEDDSGLWGYISESTGDTVIPISFSSAWNIDPNIVDIDFINYFRLSPNATFDVNMDNPEEHSGKGAFQLSRAYDASDGYIVVNIPEEGYSLITTDGETVIPAGQFYQLRPVYNGKLWAQKEEDGDWGIIQLNEEAISKEVFTSRQ